MKIGLRKAVTWYLIGAMFIIGITPRVYAGFSPSEVIGFSAGRENCRPAKGPEVPGD